MMHADWIFILLTAAGMLLSVLYKKLTLTASLTGGLLSICIYKGGGITGVTMMASFFLIGTLATSWKTGYKQRNNLAEAGKGRRAAGQVFANAGLAAMLGIIAWLDDSYRVAVSVLIAACFSSAAADTVSSELGNVYGKKYYNIITLKKAERGLNGVISAEGTALGLLGSIFIAFIYAFHYGWSVNVIIIIAAGTTGNIADSVLGATLEKKGFLGNNAVNFANTVVAGLTALVLMILCQSNTLYFK